MLTSDGAAGFLELPAPSPLGAVTSSPCAFLAAGVARIFHHWLGSLSMVSLQCACVEGTHCGALAGLPTSSQGSCHCRDPAQHRDSVGRDRLSQSLPPNQHLSGSMLVMKHEALGLTCT